MHKIQSLSFSINHWEHLYSLQQAIIRRQQQTGNQLSLKGQFINQPFLQHHSTPVSIEFVQHDSPPDYPVDNSGRHLLASMVLNEAGVNASIPVERPVFNELRKNLMEYSDIDGIHIVVTLGLLCDADHWHKGETLNIIQLDYAMKGDA